MQMVVFLSFPFIFANKGIVCTGVKLLFLRNMTTFVMDFDELDWEESANSFKLNV